MYTFSPYYSDQLAYWVGVAQSDGTLQKYIDSKGKICWNLYIQVAHLSLPMLYKFQIISSNLFTCNSKIFKLKTRDIWEYHIGVKRLLHTFKILDIKFGDPPKPPKWCLDNSQFFGAYLSGLIDGDGDIRIKRKKYPQCAIRITSKSKQKILKNYIENILRCSANITKKYDKRYFKKEKRIITGKSFSLEFLVSFKNIQFIKNFILSHLTVVHKKEKLKYFINHYPFG